MATTMLLRLLLVFTVMCYVQASIKRTTPVSLPAPCGPWKRVCGWKASCHGKKCFCNKGFHGEPLVECVRSDQFQCVVKADPHLTAFALAWASLPYPCKYRLTRLQTPLDQGVTGLAFCAFEVFGYNKIINGKYFVSGVEISFAIGDFANQFFRQQDIIKFDINEQGVESSDGGSTEFGTGVHSSWNGIDIKCKFDASQRFAILHIPRCHFSVKFRPFNPEQPTGPQSWVPAISIVVGLNTIFGKTELGRYPASLCGETVRQGDTPQLYINRTGELGLKNTAQAVVYDALNQGLDQESIVEDFTNQVLQDPQACQAAVDLFQQCSDQDKAEAIKLCFRILASRKVGRCLGILVLKAFNACVEAVCGDRAQGCAVFNMIINDNGCGGLKKVKDFCKD